MTKEFVSDVAYNDSSADELANIASALELSVAYLRRINSSVLPQRKISLAITKVEEAIMWLKKGEEK